MSNTAYLVYRPVMDYEESLSPYLIFSTAGKAEKAVTTIRVYAQSVQDKVPEYDSESETWWNEREAVVKAAEWPFGIDLSGDIGYGYSKFNSNCIEMMELPLNLTQAEACSTPPETPPAPQRIHEIPLDA